MDPMTTDSAPSRRWKWILAFLVVVVLVAVAAVAAPRVLNRLRGGHSNQDMTIDGAGSEGTSPMPQPTPTAPASPSGPPYITSVSSNGRYFLDQYGNPILVKGDSPWALMTRLSPAQARLWFSNRERHGFNAAIVSLVGAVANGAPDDSGKTYDGVAPFIDGDILQWNEPYWQRVHDYLKTAADHGITAMLYPIDGWTIGHSFVPKSTDQCRNYGTKVATHVNDLPNIVWMSGGDYFPKSDDPARGSDVDHCIDAMMHGIRDTGDNRLFSMQMGYQKSLSTDNPFWSPRVNWNFVYTYYPTYRAVLDAYLRQPPIPAVMGESNYEGENNQPDTKDTTDETLRRQALWALTSGATGEFRGSRDWRFDDGWEQRLDTRAVSQIEHLRTLFSGLPWWQLVPDTDETFVTSGRGTRLNDDSAMDVLDNDYVTASKTADGSTAVVYVPTARTISIAHDELSDAAQAVWVDPSSGATQTVPMSSTFTTPGPNAQGDHDWLLVFTTKSSASRP